MVALDNKLKIGEASLQSFGVTSPTLSKSRPGENGTWGNLDRLLGPKERLALLTMIISTREKARPR